MEISLKFGMFFFLYYLITGLALLVNPRYILRALEDIFVSNGLMLLVGFLALMFGAVVVSFHGYYELHWPVIITIMGWLAVVKGFLYLVAQDIVKNIAQYFSSNHVVRLYGVIMILASAFFAYNIFTSYTVI